MSHTLEAAILVPVTLSLLCFAVLQFPLEYQKGSQTAVEAAYVHREHNLLYEPVKGEFLSGVRTSPDRLVQFILQAADAAGQLKDLAEERFSP